LADETPAERAAGATARVGGPSHHGGKVDRPDLGDEPGGTGGPNPGGGVASQSFWSMPARGRSTNGGGVGSRPGHGAASTPAAAERRAGAAPHRRQRQG
jgi:hypothetical protein